MAQAQTLYNSLIYFEDKDKLIVSQYIPSELKWNYNSTDINIVQSINMKYYNDLALFDERNESKMSRWSLKFQVSTERNERFTLSFRVPKWVKENPVLTINDENMNEVLIEKGYININREWSKDEVLIYFPCKLEMCHLPDTFAFMEGPIVLAGDCDGEGELFGDVDKPDEILVPQYEHTYQIFPWKQGVYKTINQPQNINFMPLYDVTDEKYTVYFNMAKR